MRMSDGAFAERRDALLRRYGVLAQDPASGGEDYWRARAGALENELNALRASKAYRVGLSLAKAVQVARRVLPGRR
jgi:hypothetical protein